MKALSVHKHFPGFLLKVSCDFAQKSNYYEVYSYESLLVIGTSNIPAVDISIGKMAVVAFPLNPTIEAELL
jgi:hypothetical protein